MKPPFPRITYAEAIEVLQKAGHPMKWGDDFGGDEETVLAKQFDRPVMVHRYPAEMKAFYFKKDPKDPRVALGWTCSRPRATARSSAAASARTTSPRSRRPSPSTSSRRRPSSGTSTCAATARVPHAGFGLGVERTVAWICGLHHVRETIPFARMMERITP